MIESDQKIQLQRSELTPYIIERLFSRKQFIPDLLVMNCETYFENQEAFFDLRTPIHFLKGCAGVYALKFGPHSLFSVVKGSKCGLQIEPEEDDISFLTRLRWTGNFKCEGLSAIKLEILGR